MTWVWTSYDSTLSGNDVQRTMTVPVPAGARVVRFQVRNASCDGWTAGIDPSVVFGFGVRYEVHVVWGTSPGDPYHLAYQGYRRIPHVAAALYDSVAPVPNQRFFYGWWSAGDNELGINQGVSFGKPTDTFPWRVDLLYRFARPSLGSNPGTFKISLVWAVLMDVP